MDDLTGRSIQRQIDELSGAAARRQLDELTGRSLQKEIDELTGRSLQANLDEVTGRLARQQNQQIDAMAALAEQSNLKELAGLANRRVIEGALGLGPAIQGMLGQLVETGAIVGSALETVSRLSETNPSNRAYAIDPDQLERFSRKDSKTAEDAEIEAVELMSDDEEDSAADEGNGRLYLPREIREQIVRVEFLPFRLHHAIQKNPELMRSLSPRDFEKFVADLLPTFGFEDVTLTPRSGDGGRDVVAVNKVGGIDVVVAFECKKYAESKRIQIDTLRSLLGTITYSETRANKGVLVTTSTFTSGSKSFIVNEPMIDGKDFDALTVWVNEFAKQTRDSS